MITNQSNSATNYNDLEQKAFRIGTLPLYSQYRELEDVLSGIEPVTLRSNRRFVAPLANDDSGL